MKWWVGVIKKSELITDKWKTDKKYRVNYVGIVFPYSGIATEKKFSPLFGYMFGGYSSRKEAVNVSNYQGFTTNVKTYKQVKDMIIQRQSF